MVHRLFWVVVLAVAVGVGSDGPGACTCMGLYIDIPAVLPPAFGVRKTTSTLNTTSKDHEHET